MIFTFRSALSTQVVGKYVRWEILVARVLAAAFLDVQFCFNLNKILDSPNHHRLEISLTVDFKQGLKRGRMLPPEALLHSGWRWFGHRLNTRRNL